MAVIRASNFIPELWSEQLVKMYRKNIVWDFPKKRSYGERLLRAAAKGASQEEIDNIKRDDDQYWWRINSNGITTQQFYEYMKEQLEHEDATDAMGYSMASVTDCEFTLTGDKTIKK